MAAEATAGRPPSALTVARDQGPQQVCGGRGAWGACRDAHGQLAHGWRPDDAGVGRPPRCRQGVVVLVQCHMAGKGGMRV